MPTPKIAATSTQMPISRRRRLPPGAGGSRWSSAASAPVISLDVLKASYRELQKTTQDLESLRAKTLQESKQALDSIDVVTAEIKALSGNAAALTKQV